MSEPKHVYDWLDEPSIDMAESDAKRWLEKFCAPAHEKDREWLDARTLTCDWRGNRYICSGASRMGDVWLKRKGSKDSYDHRVDVEELSGWHLQESKS